MIYGPFARIVQRMDAIDVCFMPCRSIFTVIRSNLRVLHGSERIAIRTPNRKTSDEKIDMRQLGVEGSACHSMRRRPRQSSTRVPLQLNYVVHNFRWSMHEPRHTCLCHTDKNSMRKCLSFLNYESICSCEFVCFSSAPAMARHPLDVWQRWWRCRRHRQEIWRKIEIAELNESRSIEKSHSSFDEETRAHHHTLSHTNW